METFLALIKDMRGFLADGGAVMLPLVLLTLLLWYGLAYRMVFLKRGSKAPLREIVKSYEQDISRPCSGFLDRAVQRSLQIRNKKPAQLHASLEELHFPLTEEMRRYRSLVRTIVLVAPLAGLLGTVIGMIEMFDSLASQTFYSQSGGIANGISQALFTTQFGLVIAIPGMIIGRSLDKKEDGIGEEFHQLREYLNATAEKEET